MVYLYITFYQNEILVAILVAIILIFKVTECADDVAISSKFCDFWHACTTYGDMVGGMGCRHAYQGFSIWKLMSNIGYEFYF